MTDAYEIGIQLLLQDDVSAGLAVINRGLAEVDRAIAATSVNLGGLVHEAEAATKAVAAAVSGRAATTGQDRSESAAPAAQDERGGTTALIPGGTTSEKAAATEVKVSEPAMTLTKSPAISPQEKQVQATQGAYEQTASSSAPTKSAIDETTAKDQGTSRVETQVAPPISVAPATITTAGAAPARAATPPTSYVGTARQAVPRQAAPLSNQGAITASISRAQTGSASAGSQSARARHQSTSNSIAGRDRAVAPWSGVDQSLPQTRAASLRERAVAPQSQPQDRTEAGGTVMLDGRLVGQWLSEHMAREASRPSGGTSFFNPRQTPAWNVSGAL